MELQQGNFGLHEGGLVVANFVKRGVEMGGQIGAGQRGH